MSSTNHFHFGKEGILYRHEIQCQFYQSGDVKGQNQLRGIYMVDSNYRTLREFKDFINAIPAKYDDFSILVYQKDWPESAIFHFETLIEEWDRTVEIVDEAF